MLARSGEAKTWRTSPARHWPVTTGSSDGSTARASAAAMSPTPRGVPDATLNAPGMPASSARTLAAATSRTCTKSLRCAPSSNTRGGLPAASDERKMLATPAYGVSRGIRGP